MKLTFLGAAHEVTGSCYYLEACGKRILVDYGMEQGPNLYENQPVPAAASQIDLVLLTHAHIDHSGMLPLLYKQGFRGQIFTTPGTAQLCEIMLQDSAHIQESEAEWKNRKAMRAGRPAVEPLYDNSDALGALSCFVCVEYDEERRIADGIRVRFTDAGHLLGSASIEIWIKEDGTERKLLFSGDIGNTHQPLICDPTYPKEADYVVMESTYGDRSHGERPDYAAALAKLIQSTFDRGGNVVIPSFAVGRTQEMLYFIRHIKEQKLVTGHDGFEVWVDSPLAVEATQIFYKRMYRDFDEEATELLNRGINPIGFAGLRTAVTSEDSRAINEDPKCKVIISASGMCDAGRIKHHLKHNLWRPECTVLFVGYQAEGTLGRAILNGAKKVKLFGEEIEVRAKIQSLPGVSGHADNEGLIKWITSLEKKPRMVFVTHGEDTVCDLFSARLRGEFGFSSSAPYSGAVFDLAAGKYLYEAAAVPLQKERKAGTGSGKAAAVYADLLAAASRLLAVAKENEGGSNQDLRKFTEEINRLCEKWER